MIMEKVTIVTDAMAFLGASIVNYFARTSFDGRRASMCVNRDSETRMATCDFVDSEGS